MAHSISLQSDFSVGVEEFILFMKDPRLYEYVKGRQGVSKRELVALSNHGELRRWTIEMGLDEQMPAFARALVPSGGLRWSQHFEMNMRTRELKFRVEHPFPRHLMQVEGRGQIMALDETHTRWDFGVTFTSELPLVGARLERYAGQRTQEMMAKDAQFRQEFIDAHRGGAQPELEPDDDQAG